MFRIIDKERIKYSGADKANEKLNEFRVQMEYDGDKLKAYSTNRESAVAILSNDKKWTILKRFEKFDIGYNNIAADFTVDVAKYLNSFYNTDEFSTLTD